MLERVKKPFKTLAALGSAWACGSPQATFYNPLLTPDVLRRSPKDIHVWGIRLTRTLSQACCCADPVSAPPAPRPPQPIGSIPLGQKKPLAAPLCPGVKRLRELHTHLGRYVITNTLRHGTYGKFRLAVNDRGQACAIKEFRTYHARYRRGPKTAYTNIKAVLREVGNIQRFGHLCAVRDTVDVHGKVYVIMELMQGSLWELRGSLAHSPAAKDVVRHALCQLAEQLQSLHRDQRVHCDMTPANALWRADGRVCLADFGLAQHVQPPATHIRPGVGSYEFSAPEIDAKAFYDAKVDVWSLGMCFATLLAHHRHRPFARTDANVPLLENFAAWRQGLFDHLGNLDLNKLYNGTTRWDSLFKTLAQRDPFLCRIVLQCMLEPDVSKRASMAEVAQELRRLHPKHGPGARAAQKFFRAYDHNHPQQRAIVEHLQRVALPTYKGL